MQQKELSFPEDFDPNKVDKRDPDPWIALYLDEGTPIDANAKVALFRNLKSWSRRFILPIARPVSRTFIVINQLIRNVLPSFISSSFALHRLIYFGLKTFARPDANYLIIRHFNLATEILAFIADNVEGFQPDIISLRPKNLKDLIDNTFLIHDLNVYNFIIQINHYLKLQGRDITCPEKINYSSITDGEFEIDVPQKGFFNIIDLQTAIEMYTPLYQLFQSDHDFWRASNSLQLDESVGIMIAKVLNSTFPLFFINNRHPIVPESTLRAGFRLMLHGLAVEQIHYYLRVCKRGIAPGVQS